MPPEELRIKVFELRSLSLSNRKASVSSDYLNECGLGRISYKRDNQGGFYGITTEPVKLKKWIQSLGNCMAYLNFKEDRLDIEWL